MRNKADDRVHFSELCEFARSPAHYKYACERPRTTTREMIVGAVGDCMVFNTRKFAVYPGRARNGKEWELFKAANADAIICIESEYEDARGAAKAVLTDPVVREMGLLNGQHQRCLQWEQNGVPCAAGVPGQRGGFDVLGDDWLADLKMTTDAEPEALKRHSFRQLWHAQLAFYRAGCATIGHMIKRAYLVAVEREAPNPVTVLTLSDEVLESGDKSVCRWLEMYKTCERSNLWPGYVQSAETWELEEWQRDDQQ